MPGIIVEIIGDAKSYLRAAETAISTNTALTRSFSSVTEASTAAGVAQTSTSRKTALTAEESARIRVNASLKVRAALERDIAGYKALAVSATASAEQQAEAAALAASAQKKLDVAMGLSVASTGRFGGAVKEGERDLNKLSRGLIAGSGLASSLGRSLAFASTGFIAFAAGATLIRSTVEAARELSVAQKLADRQLKTSGTSWKVYGGQINETLLGLSHLAGFTRTDLLSSFTFFLRATGNVNESLRLMGVATDVARGRGISLQATTLALSKAVEGNASSLRRLGVIVPKSLKGWAAIDFIAKKFAGDAQNGTTAQDRLNATWTDSKEIIGSALLPTLNQYMTRFSDWLNSMNESGRLQKDVNSIVHDAAGIFHDLGGAIHTVDRLTGSFKHTVELLLALKFVSVMSSWANALVGLAGKWGAVTAAAEAAGAAQATAAGAGAAGGAAGAAGGAGLGGVAGFFSALFGRGVLKRLGRLSVASQFGAELPAAGDALSILFGGHPFRARGEGGSDPLIASLNAAVRGTPAQRNRIPPGLYKDLQKYWAHRLSAPVLDKQILAFALAHPGALPGQVGPSPRLTPRSPFGGLFANVPYPFNIFKAPPTSQQGGPFGNAKPMTQYWKKFTLNFQEQLAQAQAALTKGTADDVAEAKKEIARIKRLIDRGQLHGNALLQALALELQAVNVIQSAAAAKAQAKAQAAQKAADALQKRIDNAIDPLNLEVALSRAQALGLGTKSILKILREQRAAAWSAIHSFHLTGANLKAAYDQITSLNQAIKDQIQNGVQAFQQPMKLQVALAREQALGLPQTQTLLKMKAAATKAIKSGKYTGQNLIDLWNQIYNINQQLGQSAETALGGFKQAQIDKVARSFGLTGKAALAFRAWASQLGPGRTVPGTGTGAAGYMIGASGRPIQVNSTINIDGKAVATATTKHQQTHRRHNPTQRRGPNAAVAG